MMYTLPLKAAVAEPARLWGQVRATAPAVGDGVIDLHTIELPEVVSARHIDLIPNSRCKAQLFSYMKLLDIPLGLLINFHEPILKNGISRMILPRANRTEEEESREILL